MNLYIFRIAPNPTRVRLVLEEKKAWEAKIERPEVVVNLPEGEQRHGETTRYSNSRAC